MKNTSHKEMIKTIIKRLHEGESPETLKDQFKELLKTLEPQDISRIEEELIEEGMSPQKIQNLCDVHLAVFRESLEKESSLEHPGHPISILKEEHAHLLQQAQSLSTIAHSLKDTEEATAKEQIQSIHDILEHLKDSESHYVREENVLFPYLESHGVTQPPAIMWSEHDRIREIKKSLFRLVESRESVAWIDFAAALQEEATTLSEMLKSHFYKENNILFPTALNLFSENEWKEVRAQFDDLGYCCFTPPPPAYGLPQESSPTEPRGAITFETGTFTREQLESVLNTLPVDITFVDTEDSVRYFNKSEERLFPRTKAVIGRKVQQCHPQKSVHRVNQILDEFRSGERDSAEFWINLHDRLIYIRYFAVRDSTGTYLGCLEVTQDITDVKTITGEKRLLD
jgi:hypothetical protein